MKMSAIKQPCNVSKASDDRQPRGGYINPKIAKRIPLTYKSVEEDSRDTERLVDSEFRMETVFHARVGTVVDYLTRFMIELRNGTPLVKARMDAIHIPRLGYLYAMKTGAHIPESMEFETVSGCIFGLDDASINAMCALMIYETAFRQKLVDFSYIPYADALTCEHIRLMVNRAISGMEQLGILDGIKVGANFPSHAFGTRVISGDADYVSKSALIDMKVSIKDELTKKQTLQLAMYYILAKRTARNGCPEGLFTSPDDQRMLRHYATLNKIVIINPRHNVAYIIDMSDVHPKILSDIEDEVMGIKGDDVQTLRCVGAQRSLTSFF